MHSFGSDAKSTPGEMIITNVSDEEHEDFIHVNPGEVQVAILGEPEVGKTTFLKMIQQALPANCNIHFQDLPCLEEFSRDGYVSQVQLHDYDFYIIMGTNRVHENDIWLAKEISTNYKTFCYVRSKLDEALENNRRSKPKTHNEDDVIHKIREYCQATFQDENLGSVPIFLISNHDPDKWDFQRLKDTLVNDAPRAKAESERRIAEKMKTVQSPSWISWVVMPLQSLFKSNSGENQKRQLKHGENNFCSVVLLSLAALLASLAFKLGWKSKQRD